MKRTLLLASLLGTISLSVAQTTANYQTIPLPRNIEQQEGSFSLNAQNVASSIHTHIDASEKRWSSFPVPEDAYEIKVDKKGVNITAKTEAGLFYAKQTLRKALQLTDGSIEQISQDYELPFVTIKDGPEFTYRGVHLDCSRHFFPVDWIKKYIDIIALHGCNTLHWHITDDQGWRFEVKKYPKLTEIGSIRANTVIGHNLPIYDDTPYSGYYTQEECRDLVRYATERHITIMPEIDLPGHMVAALASYPELGCTGGPYHTWNLWGISDDVLCAGNPKTVKFICDVLKELIDVFPSPMIHLGGDECPKDRWQSCPKCQAKIKELGLNTHDGKKAEDQLQSWLMHEAELFLNANGRTMIGWDEILDGGVSDNAAIMSWRGLDGGIAAARTGHRVVMTPTSYCYLNFYQSKNRDAEPFSFDAYVPLSKTYAIPVVPKELTPEESRYILGCQVNLWAEYITSPQQAEWMLMPRLAAISEAQWMTEDARNYEQFLQRLPYLTQYYQKLGYHCSDKRE